MEAKMSANSEGNKRSDASLAMRDLSEAGASPRATPSAPNFANSQPGPIQASNLLAPPIKQSLYTGTWTKEELDYSDALADEFRSGNLPDVEDKTTLRGYLAMKLSCPVKRISKKYESSGYNGRQQYRRGVVAITQEHSQKRLHNLEEFAEKFKESREALQWAKGVTAQSSRLRQERSRPGKSAAAAVPSSNRFTSMTNQFTTGGGGGGVNNAMRSTMRLPPPAHGGFNTNPNPNLFAGQLDPGPAANFSSNALATASIQDLYNSRMLSNSYPMPGMATGNPSNLLYSSNLSSLINSRNNLQPSLGLPPSLGLQHLDELAALQQLRSMQSLSTGAYGGGNLPFHHQLGSSLSAARSTFPNVASRTRNSESTFTNILSQAASVAAPGSTFATAASSRLDAALPQQQDANANNILAEQILKRQIQESLDEQAALKRFKGGN